MARHTIPQVVDDHLSPLDTTGGTLPPIQIGSAGWYAWLNEAATRSFAYHSAHGFLTARRERRGGTWYWYAYRTRNGQLHKAYLGKAEELTSLRLNHVAAMLSVETVAGVQEPDTRKAASPPVPISLSSTSRF